VIVRRIRCIHVSGRGKAGSGPFSAVAEQQLRAASKRTALLTFCGALLIFGSLVYGAFALRDVQARKEQLEQDVIDKTDQVNALAASKVQFEQAIATKTDEISRLTKQEATLQQEIASSRKVVEDLREQLTEVQDRVEILEGRLRESASFAQYVHKVNLGTAKYLIVRSPRLSKLLSEILSFQERGLPFDFRNTADEGFTSPAFAGFILRKVNGGPPISPPEAALTNLENVSRPEIGDIIVYESGLTMFYLRDERNASFVIGMTTAGILSLEPGFGVGKLRVLKTDLARRN
jgi:hypothetical protein